ncbi:MAG: hypothetical protein KDA89_23290 [Planctomycetaceae bacterium]|nr:hypothetical protein [Planctomycetaceae bacterium]
MANPIISFRERGVSASVFRNIRRDGSSEFYSATVENSWKDEDGNYQTSSSYTEQELTALASVAMQARAWIRAEHLKQANNDAADTDQ